MWRKILAVGLRSEEIQVAIPTDRKPSKTYPAGRVCTAEGCGSILSIYNGNETCSLHGGKREVAPMSEVIRDLAEERRGPRKPKKETPNVLPISDEDDDYAAVLADFPNGLHGLTKTQSRSEDLMGWQKITMQKEAGIRFHHDKKNDTTIPYDSVTMTPLPLIVMGEGDHYQATNSAEAAEKFIDWHRSNYGEPRRASADELANRFAEFSRRFHAFDEDYDWRRPKSDKCSNCGLPKSAHAEKKTKTCTTCGGTGLANDPKEQEEWRKMFGEDKFCEGPDCDNGQIRAGDEGFEEAENDQPTR